VDSNEHGRSICPRPMNFKLLSIIIYYFDVSLNIISDMVVIFF
jgi:hypothetical protein